MEVKLKWAARRKTTEQFVREVREVLGDKYDYSKIEYLGKRTKVAVVCPAHGEWQVNAAALRRGHGCPRCYFQSRADFTLTQEGCIEAFIQTHGKVYDYSKVVFTGASKKVVIGCPIHGDFNQQAGCHVKGQGCPKCAKHGFNPNKKGFVYVLEAEGMVKVGITNKDVALRIDQINRSTTDKFNLHLHYQLTGDACKEVEKECHKRLISLGYSAPNTVFDGYTECFVQACPEMVSNLVAEVIGEIYG